MRSEENTAGKFPAGEGEDGVRIIRAILRLKAGGLLHGGKVFTGRQVAEALNGVHEQTQRPTWIGRKLTKFGFTKTRYSKKRRRAFIYEQSLVERLLREAEEQEEKDRREFDALFAKSEEQHQWAMILRKAREQEEEEMRELLRREIAERESARSSE